MTLRDPRSLLVTGGSGFIGSAFVRALFGRLGFAGRVTNLDLLTYAGNPANLDGHVPSDRYDFVRGDILDGPLVRRLLGERAIDCVVHFAAESHVDRSLHGPQAFVRTNLEGTFTLLEEVRRANGVHFHHVSTDEVYGSLGETGLFTEDTPYDPRSPYSATKAGSDHLVSAYHHTWGLSTTLSNCTNNYGPYQFPEKLVPLMILNALERKPLPVYGDGGNVRDWLYVDDHADAVWRVILDGRPGRTYAVGARNEWTNLDLLRRLLDVLAEESGTPRSVFDALITFVPDRPGHDRRYGIDPTRIETELGWRPAHDFEAGLRATVRWYLEHPEWVRDVRSGAYQQWIERNYAHR